MNDNINSNNEIKAPNCTMDCCSKNCFEHKKAMKCTLETIDMTMGAGVSVEFATMGMLAVLNGMSTTGKCNPVECPSGTPLYLVNDTFNTLYGILIDRINFNIGLLSKEDAEVRLQTIISKFD